MKPTRAQPNTVALSELSTAAMAAGNDMKYVRVIMRGTVIYWGGTSWFSDGKPTQEQLRVLPRVIE